MWPLARPDSPFRLQIASVMKTPREPRYGKPSRAAADPISGIQEIASPCRRGESSPGGLYAAMVASGVMSAGGTFMSITLGEATKLLDNMMINYSEWHTERAPQGKKVNSVEETSSLSDKIDAIMSMLVNDRTNIDPNNVPLASLVAQEEHVDVNFIKNNNFNNNAYRNNSSNNYRPYPYNNGNGYGNSYGNSYNNNRNSPPGLEAMLKEFISTQTAFNKSVEEKLGKIDILASKVDSLAADVDLLKSKVMPNENHHNKITTIANAIQVPRWRRIPGVAPHYIPPPSTFNVLLGSSWFDKPWFLSEGKLAAAHEIQSLAKELEQFKCTLPDKFVAGGIIAKLPPSWRNFATSLKHKRQEFSVSDLIGSLHVEEKARAKDTHARSFEGGSSANVVQKKNFQSHKSKNKNNGKGKFDEKNKASNSTNFKRKTPYKKKGNCHVCGAPGHWAPDCPERHDRRGNSGKSANVVIGVDTEMKDVGYGRKDFLHADGKQLTCFCSWCWYGGSEVYFGKDHPAEECAARSLH
ncbi:hypothetical protein QYE76_044775 [Lolium multiflorum]|uniref:CCHC-type domain-containing protein n=1 Tax=Lolium multiflorum TaxID=4521 RepID=A0AAD8WWV0_LOLMU|nr:hypothetical protein QYE76_044775 [Lolium multiflorum]